MPKDRPTMKDRRAQQITLLVFCLVSVEVDGGGLEEEGGSRLVALSPTRLTGKSESKALSH